MTPLACLALAVYFEARGEPEPAQFAVAEALVRRVEDWRWKDDVCSVIAEPDQLEWYAHRPSVTESWAWAKARGIAEIVLRHRTRATTCADHWHDASMTPWWADKMELELTVGKMKFYCSNEDDWRKQ